MERMVVTLPGSSSTAPLSPAIKVGDLLFTSGQVGRQPGCEIPEGIKEQTRICLENLKRVLEAGGTSLDRVVKSTVFLTDMADFDAMNEVYRGYFPAKPPARSTIGVAGLAHPNFLVEIEVIALV